MKTHGYTDMRLAQWGRWLASQSYGGRRYCRSHIWDDGIGMEWSWDDEYCEETHAAVAALAKEISDVVRLHYTRLDLKPDAKAERLGIGRQTYRKRLSQGRTFVDGWLRSRANLLEPTVPTQSTSAR